MLIASLSYRWKGLREGTRKRLGIRLDQTTNRSLCEITAAGSILSVEFIQLISVIVEYVHSFSGLIRFEVVDELVGQKLTLR